MAPTVEELTAENTSLKNENKALVRIVEKLGGPVSLVKRDSNSNVVGQTEDYRVDGPLEENSGKDETTKKNSLPAISDSKRGSISSASSDERFQRSSSLRTKRDYETPERHRDIGSSSYSLRNRDSSRDRNTSSISSTYTPRSSSRLESTYTTPSFRRDNTSSRSYSGISTSRPYSSMTTDKPPIGSYRSTLPSSSPVVSRSPRNSITSLSGHSSSLRNPTYGGASPTPRKKYSSSSSSKPSSLTSKLSSSLSSFSASKRPVKY